MAAPRGAKKTKETIDGRGHSLGSWFKDGVDLWVNSCSGCRGQVVFEGGDFKQDAKLRGQCPS